MKNEQNNKELESLTKRIRFKSLPFDEKADVRPFIRQS